MRKYLSLLLLVFALSSCSMQLNQPTAGGSSTAPSGNEQPQVTNTQVPWHDLHLTGKLIYISQTDATDRLFMNIEMLDLETNQKTVLFQAADNAWIYALAISPDNRQLVMSYALPGSDGTPGSPALYTLPLNSSKPPQLLFTPPTPDDGYFQPVWASDQHIYFSHAHRTAAPSKNGGQNQDIRVGRVALPDGTEEKIADQAFWPNISPDAHQLTYVSIDPKDATNKLILANPDGTDVHEIAMSNKWIPKYIDAPVFLPDGQTILFSAVSLSPVETPTPTLLDLLLRVTVASAHSVPSDWWSVPAKGGPAIQLTHLQTTALFASISPDKKYIASYSGYGLFVMKPDGTDLQMLSQDAGGIPSSLNWIP